MATPRAVIIADDITGSNDTGSQFARHGYRTTVVFDPVHADNEDVLVVDTETREAPPEDAYERARSVATQFEETMLYKKIDSTLRGNIAVELAAVLDAAKPDMLLLAPAFPENGRTTEDGIQLVDGRPVLESLTDSENLPASSEVAASLSQLSFDIEYIPLDLVNHGPAAVRDQLVELVQAHDEPFVAVSDATSIAHLETLASEARDLDAEVAYSGSGGLAGALAQTASGSERSAVLGIVGSISETATSQLAALPNDAVVQLDTETIITDPEQAASAVVDPLLQTQYRNGYAVAASATSSQDVAETRRAAEQLGLTESTVKRRVATALSLTARKVHESSPLSGLFTTGGTTTTAILEELDAKKLELTGVEVDEGIPLVRVREGAVDDLAMITKAGSFGGPTTIINCLDFLDTQ